MTKFSRGIAPLNKDNNNENIRVPFSGISVWLQPRDDRDLYPFKIAATSLAPSLPKLHE